MLGKMSVTFALVMATMMLMGASSCKKSNNPIDHVNFTPNADLSVIRLSLVFKNNVTSTMQGLIDTPYGNFFIDPFSTTQPFEVGFDLNMNIFYDQTYIGLKPVMTLPNGLPIGIPYPVVEIKNNTPISPKFDIYGYVDVGHLNWLGAAAMFAFMNADYFPADLSVSSVFLRDSAGNPGVIANVFGASLNADGTIARNGGIGVFANVRQLIKQAHGGKSVQMYPEQKATVIGTNAERMDEKAMNKLEKRLTQGLNGLL